MNQTQPTAKPKGVNAATPSRLTLRRCFIMTNRNGLHARPCALLVKALRPFACEVRIEHDDAIASGNSILGLMALAAGFESKLLFTITGREAARAMAAVQRLFDTEFEEAYVCQTTRGPTNRNIKQTTPLKTNPRSRI